MKKLIKMYNEKYGNTLGVIDDDFNKEQMYRIYYFIKNNCDDEEIQARLEKIKLDKPKTLEQQLTKLESEHCVGGTGTIDPTIKNDIKNIKSEVNELNVQYKDIMNKIENGNLGNNVEPQDADIPKVFFSGEKPTSKTSVHATMEYKSKTEHFKGYVDIKCQGTSSMAYPKKNYTIKIFTDSTMTKKVKKDFKGWGKQSKFCLKANYIDHSHARNICSAKLWNQIVASRENYALLPELLRTSPCNGAVDGFPIKVYYNNNYEGIYTWNIPKDKWMFNMDDTLDDHCVLCGEEYNSGCFLTANARLWSDEIHDVMPASIVTSFNAFQNFVINSTDDEFKTNLENYVYVDSLIDYYIFHYAICGLDAMGKNQLFATYDGTKWIATSYDMDSTFGLYWNGQKYVSATYRMQEDYESCKNGNPNKLYVRLEKLFINEIKARYKQLRADILSYNNIVNTFEPFMDIIGKDLYAEDLTIYTGIPNGSTNNIQQIRNYYRDRLVYVDKQINALQEAIPCTNITLNKTELTFTEADTSTPTEETINTTYEVGYINRNQSSFNSGIAGTIYTDAKNDRTTDFIDISNFSSISYTIPTSTYIGAVAYDSNKKYLKAYDRTGWVDYIATDCMNTILNITSFPENAKYIRFTSNTPDTSNNVIKAIISVNTGQEKLIATVTPTNTTDKVVWSVNPTGICSVNNGVVTPIKNGNCVVTATCGTKSATCNVTVSNLPDVPSINYELSESLVCDGTSTYKDTNIQLLLSDNIDKDWTMLVEFTPRITPASQTTIVHCMKEATPYPGINIDISNNNRRVVVPNNKQIYTGSVATVNTPIQYALIKQGKIFTLYDKIGTVLASVKNESDITPVDQTLLLGAYQDINGNKGRFFNGTINKFKLVEEIYTVPQIKQYFGIVDKFTSYTLPQETTFDGTKDYVDTRVQLLKIDQNFTITMDVTADTQDPGQLCLLHCMKETTPFPGINLQRSGNYGYYALTAGSNVSAIGNASNPLIPIGQRTKVVIVKNGTTMKAYNSNNVTGESAYNFTSIDQTLLLGAYQNTLGTKGRYFKGTIHEFTISNTVYTDEQINTYLGVTVATD